MVRSMWLFKHKFYADGTLSRYKARLVANGSSQQLGVDFDETFSPVVKPATIHTVLSLVVSRKCPIHQLDVKNAFLNGDLSKTVYMHQPPDFVDARLCHSGHSRCHSSLFIYRQRSQVAYLLLYVDDIILTASSTTLIQHLIDSLHREFDMTDLEALNYFFGIFDVRHSTGLFLSQRKYALQLLERAHMVNCNPSRTPVDTESKLASDGVPVQDPTLYRSLAGGLQYLTFTRPDLPSLNPPLPIWLVILMLIRRVVHPHAGLPQLRNLLRELHSPLSTATLVYYDNVSAVYMSANPVQHQRMKHIEIDIHFVRDMVTASQGFDLMIVGCLTPQEAKEKLDGFDKLVRDSWNVAPVNKKNAIRNFMGKLKFLKDRIRTWLSIHRSNSRGEIYFLKEEFAVLMMRLFDKGDLLDEGVIKAIYGEDGNLNKDVSDYFQLKLGNEENTRFWLDNWYEGDVIKELFPRMFALDLNKNATVSSKLNASSLDNSFRRKREMASISKGDGWESVFRMLVADWWVKSVPIRVRFIGMHDTHAREVFRGLLNFRRGGGNELSGEIDQKDKHSEDPFGLYPLLNKENIELARKVTEEDHSLSHPPGFTPEEGLNEGNTVNLDMKDYGENERDDNSFVNLEDGKDNSESVNKNSESKRSGHSKYSVLPRTGGSILNLMEEVVKCEVLLGLDNTKSDVTSKVVTSLSS
ncbi:ribonuclease H-like domain-containing protein [Tanacetum coccineum]